MIAVDVEATGTNPEKHSILAVGAVEVENPQNRIYLECRAWEGAHIDEEALQVCGFTRAQALDSGKDTEIQLIAQFLNWAEKVEEQTLLGQNVCFDKSFLEAAVRRAGYPWPFAQRSIDTHTLAYMHMQNRGVPIPQTGRHSGLDFDEILQYVGLPPEPNPHNALTGALCHAEVASRLLWGVTCVSEYTSFPCSEHVQLHVEKGFEKLL